MGKMQINGINLGMWDAQNVQLKNSFLFGHSCWCLGTIQFWDQACPLSHLSLLLTNFGWCQDGTCTWLCSGVTPGRAQVTWWSCSAGNRTQNCFVPCLNGAEGLWRMSVLNILKRVWSRICCSNCPLLGENMLLVQTITFKVWLLSRRQSGRISTNFVCQSIKDKSKHSWEEHLSLLNVPPPKGHNFSSLSLVFLFSD